MTSPSTPVGPSAAATPAVTVPPGTPEPAASEILSTALAALDAASDFQTTVTVDGTVATELAGHTVGSGTALVATTQGRMVEYVRIPPNAWAREPGATWVVVDAEQAPQSPLAALATPTTLELGPAGTGTTLQATYPAAALGLEGDVAPVSIAIDGTTVTFSYEQVSNGRTIISSTVLRPAADTTPIVAPPT